MHLDSSRSGVEFRKTEVGPGEEKWGRMLGCHVLCRKCRMEKVRRYLWLAFPDCISFPKC